MNPYLNSRTLSHIVHICDHAFLTCKLIVTLHGIAADIPASVAKAVAPHMRMLHECRSDRWSCGHDDAVVAPRAPPKSLSVQMSITPQTRPRHPAAVAAGVAVAEEDTGVRPHPLID